MGEKWRKDQETLANASRIRQYSGERSRMPTIMTDPETFLRYILSSPSDAIKSPTHADGISPNTAAPPTPSPLPVTPAHPIDHPQGGDHAADLQVVEGRRIRGQLGRFDRQQPSFANSANTSTMDVPPPAYDTIAGTTPVPNVLIDEDEEGEVEAEDTGDSEVVNIVPSLPNIPPLQSSAVRPLAELPSSTPQNEKHWSASTQSTFLSATVMSTTPTTVFSFARDRYLSITPSFSSTSGTRERTSYVAPSHKFGGAS
ncbi:hypothetical protein FRC17_006025 [Serendipita sp. 399]|nr:hypothetical protein FRC17_006025 [Serendipita sp. 399]